MEHLQDKKNILKTSDRLIISIDVSTKQELISLCNRIQNRVSTLKLGLEMIYSCGTTVVEIAKSFGYKVMIDAKLMDIPNTVSQAVAAITGLGADKITLHCLGGPKMIEEAKKAAGQRADQSGTFAPLLFGVTILTSLDNNDLDKMGLTGGFMGSVLKLAEMAVANGIDGIICSPNEVKTLREKIGSSFYIATPGIRLAQDDLNDQKRSSTPYNAIINGADFIIAGRSITSKENINEPLDIIFNEIERALG